MEIYVNRNVARRWRKALSADAADVKVFSPYITSTTADSVTRHVQEGSLEIHTVFKAELFASGASSLATLRSLMDRGHALFHVEKLHAKIIMVPAEFASIGSQNLTLGGTWNKEATVVFSEDHIVGDIEKLIHPWLEQRVPITPQMLTDMMALLPAIIKDYRKIQAAADDADKKVAELQEIREAKEHLEGQRQ